MFDKNDQEQKTAGFDIKLETREGGTNDNKKQRYCFKNCKIQIFNIVLIAMSNVTT